MKEQIKEKYVKTWKQKDGPRRARQAL